MENGGLGTDHGTSAPLFVLGAGVRGGIYGTNPDLSTLDTNGNMLLQHDYRQVYATLLRGHFGASEAMAADVLLGDFGMLGFLDTNTGVSADLPLGNRLVGAYPNPVSLSAAGPVLIRFDLARSARVDMQIYDVRGRRVSRLADRRFPAGSHRLSWEARGLAAGIYMARISTPEWQASEKLILMP